MKDNDDESNPTAQAGKDREERSPIWEQKQSANAVLAATSASQDHFELNFSIFGPFQAILGGFLVFLTYFSSFSGENCQLAQFSPPAILHPELSVERDFNSAGGNHHLSGKKQNFFKRLRVWKKHHLAKGAPLYLAFMLPGMTILSVFLFATYLDFTTILPLPLGTLGCIGIGLVLTPFVIGLATSLFLPAREGSVSIGFFNSYQLTESELVYRLCRVIPIFRVSLSEIKAIDPWRAVGPTAPASNENNPFWFLFRQTWFWPMSIRQRVKIIFSAQAIRCEYVMVCESGWAIVLGCPRPFMDRVFQQVQVLKNAAPAPMEEIPSPS